MQPSEDVITKQSTKDVITMQPSEDVITKHSTKEVITKQPSEDVITKHSTKDIITMLSSEGVIIRQSSEGVITTLFSEGGIGTKREFRTIYYTITNFLLILGRSYVLQLFERPVSPIRKDSNRRAQSFDIIISPNRAPCDTLRLK
ncbi:unnamed protein product, partial [Nesidiocoris tenuis]